MFLFIANIKYRLKSLTRSCDISYDHSFSSYLLIWTASWENQQNDCAPSEDSDQPGHPTSLIRVFAVRLKKAWVLSYPLSAQRRLWSDWADAKTLIRLGGCPGWSESSLGAQSLCWFCHEVAQLSLPFLVMKFCSGRSIRCSVSSRTDERLILDASNTAIISQEFLKTLPTGVTSCTCTIRYGGLQVSELPDQDTSDMRTADSTSNKRLSKLFVRHRADGTNNCGKSIEVTKFGLVSSFGCISRDLQLQNIPIDGNVTMILNVETPKPRDRLYQVVLEPGSK